MKENEVTTGLELEENNIGSGENSPPDGERLAHPTIRVLPGATSTFQNGYTPQQIRRAYRFDKLLARGITGANQAIGIVVAFGSPTIEQDLETFNTQFGLPPANLVLHFPQGPPEQLIPAFAFEAAIDVQWAHSLAPAATIHLVVAKNGAARNLFGAIDFATALGVQVVSISFGVPEFSTETELDVFFQHPGPVYVAASGDIGHVSFYPAASPFVVAVGGTTLPLDAQGNLTGPETAWAASGGGISPFEPEPDYQAEFGLNTGVCPHRGIPDVAFVGNAETGVAVFSTLNGGWGVGGGTSVSAPCWAAIIALADQLRAAPLTDGHQALYNLATGPIYGVNYRDITFGFNGACGPICQATTGYDFVTGLGSPFVNNLVPRLSDQP